MLDELRRYLATILLLLVSGVIILGQEKEKHPGIGAFWQGKVDEAISLLEKAKGETSYKADAEIWNTLGLAYLEKKDFKKSQKAFEKAVDLNPTATYRINLSYAFILNKKPDKARAEIEKVLQLEPRNFTALYLYGKANLWEGKLDRAEKSADEMIAVDENSPNGYMLKSEILVARIGEKLERWNDTKYKAEILKVALDTLNNGIAKSRPGQERKELETEAETIEVFYRYFSRDKTTPTSTSPDPGITPLKILSKSRPEYTEEARYKGVEGTIVIAILFGASGKIENMMLLKRLGAGLDQEALNAARKIKFEPQKKDGNPVSVVKMVEYSFDIR